MGGRGSSSMTYTMNVRGHETIGSPEPAGGVSRKEYESMAHDFTVDATIWRHPQTGEQRARSNALDAELERRSFDGAMYRGVAVSDEKLKSYKVGAIIDQGGLASWSQKQYVAEGYAADGQDMYGGNKVVYVMEKGTRKGGDISALSQFKNELEVATSSKSSQVITRKRSKNGIMYIYLEEVRDG